MANGSKVQKSKRKSIACKLVSSAGTGFFYIARRNPKRITKKYQFKKYDPVVKAHVMFDEEKL